MRLWPLGCRGRCFIPHILDGSWLFACQLDEMEEQLEEIHVGWPLSTGYILSATLDPCLRIGINVTQQREECVAMSAWKYSA